MRIISAPARAECELDHRFFSTMPSAKYSHCLDYACRLGEPTDPL